ncbi:PREDICTED: uncharacterized protein LOC108365805 [Rhagoletis zephyria]|uniref:uncharacterized protein LOC108365805 n=1 Tax=Rhagoletis zephyria TaxID=28612 RepID=UPI0008119184|nr:PREDICTED: uncharacterized protein LOC108365805 [Rhagoletis zephyria]
MTSSNINKIMRSNITLKPWILSKNTSEIVNACIQKIYKQTQNNFKNDPSKIAAAKPENKGPLRALKSQERVRTPLNINVLRAKKGAAANNTPGDGNAGTAAVNSGGGVVGERLASNAAANSRRGAVANLTAQRKLLKSSPNYKIYTSRRFGSSASSSNASIFRRNDVPQRRRSTTQTAQLNYLLRTYATQLNAPSAFTKQSVLPKFMISARNQHMQSRTEVATPSHVAHLVSAIQRDLLPINTEIKNRIALGRPRMGKLAAQKATNDDPMSGWHHPPAQELFLSRLNQQGIASTELQEQYRRMKNANKMRQFENLRQLERRNMLLGSMGKKALRHIQNEVEVNAEVATKRDLPHRPTRQQTPNFEESYAIRAMPQQAYEADAIATPSTLATLDAPQAFLAMPRASQLTSAAPSHAVTHSGQSRSHSLLANEERYVSSANSATPAIDAPTAANSAATAAKQLSLPAQSEAKPTPLISKQFLRITKHSATSQLSRAAAQNQMRFNHSAHLKKI